MGSCSLLGIVAQACFGAVFVASPKRRLRSPADAFGLLAAAAEVGADDVVVHWETNEHTTLSLKEASRRVISAAPERPLTPPPEVARHEAGGATHAATTPAAAQALDPATAAIREAYAREQAVAAKAREENAETPKPEAEAADESDSDSDDESLNAMRRSARERLDAATFTTGSKVEVTSPGGVCCTSGVVVHDNHHGVSVRFKIDRTSTAPTSRRS